MIGLFAGNNSYKVEGSISMTAKIATIVFFLYVFAMLIPSISVGTRRLHDTGRSGWWMWLLLIPYIGWLVLFIFFVLNSEWGSNKYGDNPKGMENNSKSQTKSHSTHADAKQNVYQTTNNNPDYSTNENIVVNNLSDTNVSDVSESNKLVCPRCGLDNIKLPGNNALKVFDKNESNMMNTVAKAHLGFLYDIVGDTVLRFKCMNCKYKW